MMYTVCMDHVFHCRKREPFICGYLSAHKGVCSCLCMRVCEMFEPESWGGGGVDLAG